MSSFAGATGPSPVIGIEIDITVIACRNLKACDTKLFGKGSSDPYVEVFHGLRKIGKTQTITKNLNPVYNADYKLHLQDSASHHKNETLSFKVFDYDKFSSPDPMGIVELKLGDFMDGQVLNKWFELKPCPGCSKPKGDIHLKLSLLERHAVLASSGGTIPLHTAAVGFCMGWELPQGIEIDLDTSIAAFDAKGSLLIQECVYYGNLRNSNGSIQHSGDEQQGISDLGYGDDERIVVYLNNLPHHVSTLFLIGTVCTPKKTFADVKSARLRFIDWSNNGTELCRFIPALQGAHTALIMGRATKNLNTGQWTFAIIGDSDHTARDFGTLIPELKSYQQDLVPGIRIDPNERVALMRKGGVNINLNDYCNPLPDQLTFGLAWDITKGRNIDLDASVIVLDADLRQLDIVFFGKLQSNDGAIQHCGDEREGDEKGDDEKILINVPAIHSAVKYICFVVNSYSGEELDDIAKASCHLFDSRTQRDLLVFKLTKTKFLDKKTALLMGFLFRNEATGGWGFQIIAEGALGRTANENVDEVQRYLQRFPVQPLPPPRLLPVSHSMPPPCPVVGVPTVQVVASQFAGVTL